MPSGRQAKRFAADRNLSSTRRNRQGAVVRRVLGGLRVFEVGRG